MHDMDTIAPGYCPPTLRLSEHFSVAEFTASETAARQGVDNRLPLHMQLAATVTAQMMERIRAALCQAAGRDIAVHPTSAWRCDALNELVGSSPTSDHPRMLAVDFVAPTFGMPLQVAQLLQPLAKQLGIGQLIHEYGQWVHASRGVPAQPINAVITIDRWQGKKRVRSGIHPANA